MFGLIAPREESIQTGLSELHLAPSADAVLEELEKILSSKTFHGAPTQERFLRYVVEQALSGNGDKIKGYTIGIDVFNRNEAFDDRRDNVVRTHARKLRGTLAKYYQQEGVGDPVRIEFPLGTYVPVFQSAEVSSSQALAEPTALVEKRPFRWKLKWAVAVLLFLSAATAYLLQSGWRASVHKSSTPSIAVLAFRNLNNDKEEEFFSDGLTEDLTDSLTRVPGLRVVAPSSAFQFREKGVDVRDVGKKLNVGVVLEGSVRRFENRVRITTQLSDATSGFRVWSASYDREIKDVLAIQHEISGAITSALGVTLAGSKPQDAEQADVIPDPETYQDYLKGRYLFTQGTRKSLDAAIEYFEKAIARDPGYAPAYAGLARCYAGIAAYASATSTDLIRKITETASKALALDSKLGEAHLDLARAYTYQYQWSMAEQEIRKALEIGPGVAEAHEAYGLHLVKMGRLPEALAEYKKSLNLDPVSASSNRLVPRTLYFMRRYDEAIKLYKEALEFDPNSAASHRGLGIAYVMRGMYPQGIAEMEFGHSLAKDYSITTIHPGYAYAVAGRTDVARKILNTLLQSSADPTHSLSIAQVYLGLGDKDKTFEWLRRAINERNVNLSLKADPIYDPLRSDPRFAELLRLMNLS